MNRDDDLPEEMNRFCPSDHEFPLHEIFRMGFHEYYTGKLFDKVKDNYDINAKDRSGNTPFHILAINILKYRDISLLITKIVQSGGEINSINNDGDTPLHVLLKESCSDDTTASEFIEQHEPKLDILDKYKQEPLRTALSYGNYSTVEVMLKKNENLYYLHHRGFLLIHYAVLSSLRPSLSLLRVLLCHNHQINLQCRNGNTALHYLFSEQTSFDKTLEEKPFDENRLTNNKNLLQIKKYFMLLVAGIDERILNNKGIQAKPIKGSAIDRYINRYKHEINLIREEIRSEYISPEMSLMPMCGEVIRKNIYKHNTVEGINKLLLPRPLKNYLIKKNSERIKYMVKKLKKIDDNDKVSFKQTTIRFNG